MAADWAGRIYRFSGNEKLHPVLTSLLSKIGINDVDSEGLTAPAHAAMRNDVVAKSGGGE